MKLLLKILLVVTLSWLLDGVVPTPGPDHPPVVAHVAETSGHGAYCLPAQGPVIFLGRDLPAGIPYARFEAWCRAQDGLPGWQE